MNISLILLTVLVISYILLCSSSVSKSTTITCDDAYACENEILKASIVKCNGYYGCHVAKISATTVIINGAYGAMAAVMTATRVYVEGFMSAYFGTITADHVIANGKKAVYYATIKTKSLESNGFASAYSVEVSPLTDELTVSFLGYYSGFYAGINCFKGDTCFIDCGTAHGCSGAKFYCYEGAKCDYYCNGDAEHCITMIGGVTDDKSALYLTDVEIKAIYDRNVEEKKKRMYVGEEVVNDLLADDVIDHVVRKPLSSEGETCSNVFGAGYLFGLISTAIGMIAVFVCWRKRNKYSDFTPLLE